MSNAELLNSTGQNNSILHSATITDLDWAFEQLRRSPPSLTLDLSPEVSTSSAMLLVNSIRQKSVSISRLPRHFDNIEGNDLGRAIASSFAEEFERRMGPQSEMAKSYLQRVLTLSTEAIFELFRPVEGSIYGLHSQYPLSRPLLSSNKRTRETNVHEIQAGTARPHIDYATEGVRSTTGCKRSYICTVELTGGSATCLLPRDPALLQLIERLEPQLSELEEQIGSLYESEYPLSQHSLERLEDYMKRWSKIVEQFDYLAPSTAVECSSPPQGILRLTFFQSVTSDLSEPCPHLSPRTREPRLLFSLHPLVLRTDRDCIADNDHLQTF
jgi:hypothetical protein